MNDEERVYTYVIRKKNDNSEDIKDDDHICI